MLKLLLWLVFCCAWALTGCTSVTTKHATYFKPAETVVSYTAHKHKPKNSSVIAIYEGKPHVNHPYRVIGKETVSRYNRIGFERKTKTVNQIMKKLAASIGGDAVINVTEDGQRVEGTIILFERVVL